MAKEPPAINPFGPRSAERDDAMPGYVELSDGKVLCGMIHLTRDARLKIHDEKIGRLREIPLRAVMQIDCRIKREWMEKEWRFKEAALDEKMYTGRQYPAREYLHEITLQDGRKIKGSLAALVYVQCGDGNNVSKSMDRLQIQRCTLHKRQKGNVGTKLKDLVYVKLIKLGKEALEEGRRKAGKKRRPGRDPAEGNTPTGSPDSLSIRAAWAARGIGIGAISSCTYGASIDKLSGLHVTFVRQIETFIIPC